MPNEFTKLAARYTVPYSIGVGGILAVILFVFYGANATVSFLSGLAFGVITWFWWRPGGFFRRREKEVSGEPVDVKKVILLLLFGVVMFAAAFVAIRLTN